MNMVIYFVSANWFYGPCLKCTLISKLIIFSYISRRNQHMLSCEIFSSWQRQRTTSIIYRSIPKHILEYIARYLHLGMQNQQVIKTGEISFYSLIYIRHCILVYNIFTISYDALLYWKDWYTSYDYLNFITLIHGFWLRIT